MNRGHPGVAAGALKRAALTTRFGRRHWGFVPVIVRRGYTRRVRELRAWISVHKIAGYVVALGLTAIVTGAIWMIERVTDVANISMLYLLAVMTSAIAFGSGPAILASIAAFFAFNFFFIQPTHRLNVSQAEEWVALGLLLLTGVITGQLAAALRNRAREAARREREAVVLYDVLRLMTGPDLRESLAAVAERLRQEMALAAVVIGFHGGVAAGLRAEAGEREAVRLALASGMAPKSMLGAGAVPTPERRGSPGRWIRVLPPHVPGRQARTSDSLREVPVRLADGTAGVISLVRHPQAAPFTAADDRLLSAVGNQLAIAIERTRLREEAAESEILRRSSELKTALLNTVSHDLRTPLSSILASAGSLLQEDVRWTEEERSEFARAIEQEAERLNRVVGNLLDLSRIQAGSLVLQRAWYDLGALVDDVLGRLRAVISHHGLTVSIAEELPPVFLDYILIDEVLANLVENAAKYSPQGSEIMIRVTVHGDEVRLEVADRGPGIPPEALPRLFEPFYRVRREGRTPRGTGLGLAVTKGLVEAHGGRIWAKNREGGGVTFQFSLPLGQPDGAPVELPGDRQ
jgi:two-component system sensor histidine kinase KdpD